MTELTREDGDDTLVVVFATAEPIGAAEVGLLLRELSSDYKRVTGGRLVLWRYETGSSWIHLRDAIAVAGSLAGSFNDISIAVQHMAKFVQHLKLHFEKSKEQRLEDNGLDLVTKSATRIVKIAAESGADIAVRYRKDEKNGLESYSLTVNHQQAVKLLSTADQAKRNRRRALPRPQSDQDHARIEQVANRLIGGGVMSDDLVDTLVLALKSSGGKDLLPVLADKLDIAGRPEMARIVRRHIPGASRSTLRLPKG
jgi:hypothetical protein